MPIDLATAPTTSFEPGAAHAPLLALVGEWAGPTQTWLDPSAPPDVTHTSAHIEALLGGRVVRASYTGIAAGKPHTGMFLLTFDEAEACFAMAWIDSFHMGTGLMYARGAPTADGGISFLGSYAAGSERWGWRTVIRPVDASTLSVEATNISPEGQEFRAVETRLSR